MLLELSHFSPGPPLIPTVSPHTTVHVHGSCMYILWLFPLPSFNQVPPPPFLLTAVSLFHVSIRWPILLHLYSQLLLSPHHEIILKQIPDIIHLEIFNYVSLKIKKNLFFKNIIIITNCQYTKYCQFLNTIYI